MKFKNYIDSLLDKAEATSRWSGSSWNADQELLGTIYRLCNDHGYYPSRYPRLCESYISNLQYPMWDSMAAEKCMEVACSGLEHCTGQDRMAELILEHEVEAGRARKERTPGCDGEAYSVDNGLLKLKDKCVDFSKVWVRGLKWECRENGCKPCVQCWTLTTIIESDYLQKPFVFEWNLQGAVVDVDIDELCFKEKYYNLRIEREKDGRRHIMIYSDNPSRKTKLIEINVPDDGLRVIFRGEALGFRGGEVEPLRNMWWEKLMKTNNIKVDPKTPEMRDLLRMISEMNDNQEEL